MSLWRLIRREILYNKLSFFLGLFSVIIAVGIFTAELTLLSVHDLQTHTILTEKEEKTKRDMARMEDDYRIIMKDMGFNLLIMPKGQQLDNFYSEGYASKYMPEEYVTKLSNSEIVTVQHLLPSIEQKIRWPEQNNRTIVLIGTRGEVPYMRRDPKAPILVAVPPGEIVLGYEIWNSLGLKLGDTLRLLGTDFRISVCHSQRGSKDDITVWIDLKKAQELLGKEGMINAIMALKCHCAGNDIKLVRQDVVNILPDVKVIEIENKVVARARARDRAKATADSALAAEGRYRAVLRHEKEAFAAWLIPLVIICSAALIGLITFSNVRERKYEMGILRAIGLRSNQILSIFLAKALLMGLLGAMIGYGAGFFIGLISGEINFASGSIHGLFNPALPVVVLLTAPLLSSFASWVPALMASRQDPAIVLKEE